MSAPSQFAGALDELEGEEVLVTLRGSVQHGVLEPKGDYIVLHTEEARHLVPHAAIIRVTKGKA